MTQSLEILAGLLGAIVFMRLARRRSPHGEVAAYAFGLAVAALIYVGFAFVWGEPADWIREAAGLAGFGLWAAWARARPSWLSTGWVAHGAWDLLLHGAAGPGIAPSWYPTACIGFDLALAAHLLWIATTSRLSPAEAP